MQSNLNNDFKTQEDKAKENVFLIAKALSFKTARINYKKSWWFMISFLLSDLESLNLISRKKAELLESRKAGLIVFEIYK